MRRAGTSIDNRKREILATIVRNHIATGQPVGSLSLSRRSGVGLSSASIRNVCAELEEEGYLTHPHTSAGRLPTDKGYRFYVDHFVVKGRVSRTDAARINERLLDEDATVSVERLMERTCKVLSDLSDNVGIVITPAGAQDRLQHIDFVKLSEQRILVITVSSAGRVQDRVIRSDSEFSQDELSSTAKYLEENFHGWTLTEIRDELLRRMTEEKALYDRFLRNAVVLCSQGLQEGDQPDVFIEGASSIITKPEFGDAERMQALFKTFEQKSRMVKILNECIDGARREAVAVRIGSENFSVDLRDCTVIASSCTYADGTDAGTIGVVGPTRLEYDRLISIVNYVSKLYERMVDPENGISRATRSL